MHALERIVLFVFLALFGGLLRKLIVEHVVMKAFQNRSKSFQRLIVYTNASGYVWILHGSSGSR